MRVLVRLLSALLGLAVAGAGALLALEVGWQWWRPSAVPLVLPWPEWKETLATVSWNSAAVRITAALIGVAGVVLLVVAGLARRRDVAFADPADEVTVTTSPRSLARVVGQHVRAHDNVTAASVTATARKVRVRAVSTFTSERELRPELLDSVATLLGDLPLARQPKLSVVVDSPKDRR
ncbi:hypothetical protein BAY61_05560 [Prauserella marina]|uniref:Uncharacterized protein n=1 Tax=Prauserella marina TaxID=530584 RepID=A0A222VKV1_9PSEU|nr:DUF6286 domain-containing protein [Prauserella marina]ASR34545.1 hypothetical protein BAY61_05560 [Prauserella marina]PWV85846.1 hypothetical protein DES30_1011876 [Prauserella marina]SDC44069.1 hypothetical protein SAMN05421630_102116 [Prauserella marina]